MTTRWPTTLLPRSCVWGRSRNPARSMNAITQRSFASQRARPLWTCEVFWDLLPEQAPPFRLIMEAMDGGVTPYVMWDFANGLPRLSSSMNAPIFANWENGQLYDWGGTVNYDWIDSLGGNETWLGTDANPYQWQVMTNGGFLWTWTPIDYSTFSGTIAMTGSFAAGSTSIQVTGCPASTLILIKGDLIEIDEYLYVVGNDVLTNASGVATITLTTGLVVGATVASVIVLTNPGCRMRLVGGDWGLERQWDDGLFRASAQFLEVA